MVAEWKKVDIFFSECLKLIEFSLGKRAMRNGNFVAGDGASFTLHCVVALNIVCCLNFRIYL